MGWDPAVAVALQKRPWVVYLQKPFAGAEAVFSYLGRYTHRVGVSEARLVRLQAGHVTFRTRGDQRITLPVPAFVARFLDHVVRGWGVGRLLALRSTSGRHRSAALV